MARLWFYNIPYHGHVNPTLPLIRELVLRGHAVTYFSSDSLAERIQATGAEYRPYSNVEAFAETRTETHTIYQASLLTATTHVLLPEVLRNVDKERPDALMFDMSAPWGSIASRRNGIPSVASFPHLPFYWRTVMEDRRVFRKFVASVRPGSGNWRSLQRQIRKNAKDNHLRKPADLNMLSSSAELNIVYLTRYYQPYATHFDESYLYVGPTIETERGDQPFEMSRRPEQLLIYIAVGTVYKANLQFFRHCMEAFADPKYAVILSVGRAVDPTILHDVPANFAVAQYVPQLQVLQQADLFITHAGMGSLNEAVYYGVPMVMVPNTIEQTINAARMEQLACGVYLDHVDLTTKSLIDAARSVLGNPLIESGLVRLKDSFAQAGGAMLAADVIEGTILT